jgi:hypothetical protein
MNHPCKALSQCMHSPPAERLLFIIFVPTFVI